MRTLFNILFVVSSLTAIGQTEDYLISGSITVAEGFGNHHPQLEITNDGRPCVSWTDPVTESAYFAKYNGVDGFSDPIKLNPDGLAVASYNWSGPDFTIEGNNIYVVFRAANYQSYLVKSTDNGESFGDTVRIADASANFPFYPDVAVLNDTIYATFMNHLADDGSGPNYVFSRSVDGGVSFEPFVLASSVMFEDACDCCPPEIIVNESYVIIFFREDDDNIRDIKAVVSYDRGATFSDWFSVDDHEWLIMACPSTGPDARFIGEHQIVTAYKTFVEGNNQVYANIYDITTGESNLSQILATDELNLLPNYPQVAYENNKIGIVWEAKAEGTSTEVYFNMTGTEVINFDPDNALKLTNYEGVQSKPDIALRSGIFHVVYADDEDGNVHYLQLGESNGVLENELLAIDFYPVPVEDMLTITSPENGGLIQITDIQGRLVTEKLMTGTTTILNTTDWPKGIYLLHVSQNGLTTVEKIVK